MKPLWKRFLGNSKILIKTIGSYLLGKISWLEHGSIDFMLQCRVSECMSTLTDSSLQLGEIKAILGAEF